ncbi:hypothetical protein MNBD_GAMMA11-2481 [hydrothermal vent metagenome]|uniref:Uncharacterized protein n=1 Tax=hydrothermal vent metagenome TaxID=652676 RepID=A0A3B0WPW6_9ZZZZ
MNRKRSTLSIPLLFVLLVAPLGNAAIAESLDQKLQQCKQAFSLSHSKDATQEAAAVANLKHLKLMKEILHELNKKNVDKKMTDAQLQENVMVMSHLLEMLVTENLSRKEQSWNLNY